MEQCEKCGDFIHFIGMTCDCKLYTVGFNGEFYLQYARTEEEAAEKFVSGYLLAGESVIIDINGSEYFVSAEASIEYTVEKLEE